ncbi:hypothetical protein BK666_13725 [Pseudomonas frederiksbergensis]|uniref:Uncharacterized protein n=1 Tax=Pseudomonas frederiksbergensis TaxID=104087 RepID=A0A423K415_9PSED|nr:hypothetical protein [Pseudomonas frederiksbergensis]RON46200.1 hypothetical protein BK666_13725 [Pseudomonas frederiksbergensis]
MSNKLGKVFLPTLMLGVACALLVAVGSLVGSHWLAIVSELANDLEFLGFVLAIVAMGLSWRGVWRNAVLWKMGAGALLFLGLFLYLSVLNTLANNQSAHVSDSFFCIICLALVIVSFRSRSMSLSVGCLKQIML